MGGVTDSKTCVLLANQYCGIVSDWFGWKSDLYCHYYTMFGGSSTSAKFETLMTNGRYGGIGAWTPPNPATACATYSNGTSVTSFGSAGVEQYNKKTYGDNGVGGDVTLGWLVPRVQDLTAYVEGTPEGATPTQTGLDTITWTDDALILFRTGINGLYWRNIVGKSQGTSAAASASQGGIDASTATLRSDCSGRQSYKVYINTTTYISVLVLTAWVPGFPEDVGGSPTLHGSAGCVGLPGCHLVPDEPDCDATPGCYFATPVDGTTMTSTSTGTTPGGFGTLPNKEAQPTVDVDNGISSSSGDREVMSVLVTIALVGIVFALAMHMVLARRGRRNMPPQPFNHEQSTGGSDNIRIRARLGRSFIPIEQTNTDSSDEEDNVFHRQGVTFDPNAIITHYGTADAPSAINSVHSLNLLDL